MKAALAANFNYIKYLLYILGLLFVLFRTNTVFIAEHHSLSVRSSHKEHVTLLYSPHDCILWNYVTKMKQGNWKSHCKTQL